MKDLTCNGTNNVAPVIGIGIRGQFRNVFRIVGRLGGVYRVEKNLNKQCLLLPIDAKIKFCFSIVSL